ncbi:TrkH family potassium uptake protein [Oribacterium sp. C9]|uniref:TrkH family potassium uptake protein n=1 Tax=Oribacterium sp. C9 TaxID=1943579 RepID=UPI00098F83F3|nr:potassium transporter TrkG [Oribacterium sp. C9]
MYSIKKKSKKKTKFKLSSLSTTQQIALSFLLAIIVGTILLMLPAATVTGEETSFLTALFTATTSVCITGLVVVDTFSHWTLFGQAVILFLIQVGGMGVVCISAVFLLLMRKGLSLKTRVLMMDALNLSSIKGVVGFCKRVIADIFIVEAVGALLTALVFVPRMGNANGIFAAVFHSVSAFCNAGIDVLGSDSLMAYSDNYGFLLVTMSLIVLGGLGFVVWFDVIEVIKNCFKSKEDKKRLRLSEHTRLVFALTCVFILSGAVLVFIAEKDNPETMKNMTMQGKIWNSIFQSVTFRTAGFMTVSQKGLRDVTAFTGLLYMFVGGSPMGTAGGVKTVTFFALILYGFSSLNHHQKPVIFNRAFSFETIHKAVAIIIISFLVTCVLSILLMLTNPEVALVDALYEVFSATATVGLSRNLTSSLNAAGKVIIIIAMYLGRIGPISLVMFFRSSKGKTDLLGYAEGKYYIG